MPFTDALRGDVRIFALKDFSRFGARSLALAGAILLSCVLGGCASQMADAPLVGLPANTPARPVTPAEYLPVHDLPAARQETVLNPDQRAKLEKDLVAARDRQTSGAAKQTSKRQNN
jgi:hypothetical protein